MTVLVDWKSVLITCFVAGLILFIVHCIRYHYGWRGDNSDK